jgi:hypothetical protein
MDQESAEKMAAIYNGEVQHTGGNVWVVICKGENGRIVVFCQDVVCEYRSMEDFDNGENPIMSIFISF